MWSRNVRWSKRSGGKRVARADHDCVERGGSYPQREKGTEEARERWRERGRERERAREREGERESSGVRGGEKKLRRR